MPTSKVSTATAVELVARRLGVKTDDVRKVLDDFYAVADLGLQAGHEVELGHFGYLSLKEPKQVAPPKGELHRGKRVAFREKNANRLRYK